MSKKLILIFIILILVISSIFLFKNYFKKGDLQIQENKKQETKNEKNIEENKNIIVFYPKPNEKIKSPLKIIGKAKGTWFFEASFPVILTNWDGEIIAEHYVEAKEDWMTENFVSFETVLEFKSPVFDDVPENHFSRNGYLIFKKNNPSGLPEYDESIEIPIKFE